MKAPPTGLTGVVVGLRLAAEVFVDSNLKPQSEVTSETLFSQTPNSFRSTANEDDRQSPSQTRNGVVSRTICGG
jgi:hypothetical protein